MNKKGFFYRVYDLYVDGFRRMTLGRVLWAVVIVKLVVVLVVLKLLFFPDFIGRHAAKGNESEFVARQLTEDRPLPVPPSVTTTPNSSEGCYHPKPLLPEGGDNETISCRPF